LLDVEEENLTNSEDKNN